MSSSNQANKKKSGRPSKDANSDSTATTHSTFKDKYEEMKCKLVTNGSELSTFEFQQAMFAFFEEVIRHKDQQLEEQKARMDTLEKKISQQINRIADLEKETKIINRRLNKNEIDEAKRGVVLSGVNMHGNDGREDKTALQQLVQDLCSVMNVDIKMVENVQRLPASRAALDKAKERGQPVSPPIRIRFNTPGEKYHFLSNLKELKAMKEAKNMKFSQEIPNCLKSEWLSLEQKAYQFRQQQPKSKTRLSWRGDELTLEGKRSGDKVYSKIESQ